MNRSALFTAYNAARTLARRGQLDRSRLDKALGLCQLRDEQRTAYYHSTAHDCSCPDRRHRGAICKHMIAAALSELARRN